MTNGLLVMEPVGDEVLYSYLKLGFLGAVWQPAWCSCQPLSAQTSSLLPCLHCPTPTVPLFHGLQTSAPAQS